MPPARVVVTGASGFIGRAVVRALLARGHAVHALVRSPEAFLARTPAPPGRLTAGAWQLGDAAPAGTFDDAGALVHLACATRGEPAQLFELNVRGTKALLGSTPAHVFRVFTSSFSAGPAGDAGLAARSAYSAGKQAAETLFDLSRDLVVRPGLVVGPGEDGLFARMRTQMERGVPIPLFYMGRTPVQWIHVDELADALVTGVEQRTTGRYSLAAPDAVTLDAWTTAVAGALHLPTRTLKVPGIVSDLGALVLRGAERFGLKLPVASDTVYGIKYATPVDTRSDLARLGLQVAPLGETLARSV